MSIILPVIAYLLLLSGDVEARAWQSNEKNGSLSEGTIASIDMNKIYIASGAAKTLVDKARENGKAAEERIQLILSAPYLTLPEFSEFATLAAKEQPTADETSKIKQFKISSDKGAMDIKILEAKQAGDLTNTDKIRIKELRAYKRQIDEIAPNLELDFQRQQEDWAENYRNLQLAQLRAEVSKIAMDNGVDHLFDTSVLLYSSNDMTPILLEKYSGAKTKREKYMAGGKIGSADVRQLYFASHAKQKLLALQEQRIAEGTARINSLKSIPFLNQKEIFELSGLLGKDALTAEEQKRVTYFKTESEKRTLEYKTLQTKSDPSEADKTRLTELVANRDLLQQMIPGFNDELRHQQEAWAKSYELFQINELRADIAKAAKSHGIAHVFDASALLYSSNDLTAGIVGQFKKRDSK